MERSFLMNRSDVLACWRASIRCWIGKACLTESIMNFGYSMMIKTLFAIVGTFVVVTPSLKAQDNLDMKSFWFGWSMGATGASCELANAGKLSHEEARQFMQGAIQEMSDDADLRKYVPDIQRGYNAYTESNQDCR